MTCSNISSFQLMTCVLTFYFHLDKSPNDYTIGVPLVGLKISYFSKPLYFWNIFHNSQALKAHCKLLLLKR